MQPCLPMHRLSETGMRSTGRKKWPSSKSWIGGESAAISSTIPETSRSFPTHWATRKLFPGQEVQKPWLQQHPQPVLDGTGPRSLDLLTEVGTQCQRAVIVQLLMTSPPHGIAHSLYLNLSSKFQSFPIGDAWKHELCLPNFAR